MKERKFNTRKFHFSIPFIILSHCVRMFYNNLTTFKKTALHTHTRADTQQTQTQWHTQNPLNKPLNMFTSKRNIQYLISISRRIFCCKNGSFIFTSMFSLGSDIFHFDLHGTRGTIPMKSESEISTHVLTFTSSVFLLVVSSV